MTNSLEILTKVRELLSDPNRWTKGSYARLENKYNPEDTDNSVGNEISWGSPDATCFCLVGAIYRCDGANDEERLLADEVKVNLLVFNDHPNTTHADILALLDAKIAKLKVSYDS